MAKNISQSKDLHLILKFRKFLYYLFYRGLFGMTTVCESDKIIVITEGEFDAMAVHQETGLPCVSLPNGANSLPISLLKFFNRFERIYLWLDADEVG